MLFFIVVSLLNVTLVNKMNIQSASRCTLVNFVLKNNTCMFLVNMFACVNINLFLVVVWLVLPNCRQTLRKKKKKKTECQIHLSKFRANCSKRHRQPTHCSNTGHFNLSIYTSTAALLWYSHWHRGGRLAEAIREWSSI